MSEPAEHCPEPKCFFCGKPEAQHVWLSSREMEMWRPESGKFKTNCDCGDPEKLGRRLWKVYSPLRAGNPEDPCDVDLMREISS